MSICLPPWWLDVEPIGEMTVVRFVNGVTLNEELGYALSKYLRSLVEEGACRRLVLNLNRIDFLDSMLIGKLFGLHRTMKSAGGHLALCGVGAQLDCLLELVRLPQLIPIGGTEDDALRVLNSLPSTPAVSVNVNTLKSGGQKTEVKWREEPAVPVPGVGRRLRESPSPA